MGVYPRVCGGTLVRVTLRGKGSGLSPRVRGNHDGADRVEFVAGSIPACAGEPFASVASADSQRVYPRVCGGTHGRHHGGWAMGGLSPRVRGNPTVWLVPVLLCGSIPACAGEPWTR